jgi:hypothetical protein
VSRTSRAWTARTGEFRPQTCLGQCPAQRRFCSRGAVDPDDRSRSPLRLCSLRRCWVTRWTPLCRISARSCDAAAFCDVSSDGEDCSRNIAGPSRGWLWVNRNSNGAPGWATRGATGAVRRTAACVDRDSGRKPVARLLDLLLDKAHGEGGDRYLRRRNHSHVRPVASSARICRGGRDCPGALGLHADRGVPSRRTVPGRRNLGAKRPYHGMEDR